ncbi:hypothetical protein N0V82_000800 [Gnomoniopsis sp. IMI 355080]|nr:hypothetical protein N0V82_000800 [Gnomoniopsis sp. IMI 355080]
MADYNFSDSSAVPPAPQEASGADDSGSVEAVVQSIANETENAASDCSTSDCEDDQTADDFGDRIVYIFVGPKRVKYTIHEHVLSSVAKNSFFSKLFNNDFKEASIGQADLPEDSPRLFGCMVKWLYAAHVGVKNFTYLLDPLSLKELFEIYTFGQKYLIEDFQDAIIVNVYARLHSNSHSFFTIAQDTGALDEFQENILPASKMHELVVKSMAFSLGTSSKQSWRTDEAYASADGYGVCNGGYEGCDDKAEEALAAISDELMQCIFRELLGVAARDCCRGFECTVGYCSSFMLNAWSHLESPHFGPW